MVEAVMVEAALNVAAEQVVEYSASGTLLERDGNRGPVAAPQGLYRGADGDWVAVSVGDGCTIAGVWKAFREMKTLGLIEHTPRMLGVQAEGAAPITEAFRSGLPVVPIEPHTVADSIAVGVPRNGVKALLAVQESGGAMINVSDDEIVDAMRCTGRLTGIFAEPAAATSIAGVRAAVEQGIMGRRTSAVAMVTGNGLKDIRSAQSAVRPPIDIARDADVRNMDFSLHAA